MSLSICQCNIVLLLKIMLFGGWIVNTNVYFTRVQLVAQEFILVTIAAILNDIVHWCMTSDISDAGLQSLFCTCIFHLANN